MVNGYSTVITRLSDGRLSYAGFVPTSAWPFHLIVGTFNRVRDFLRCFRHCNMKVYVLSLALALSIVTHILEIPGTVLPIMAKT